MYLSDGSTLRQGLRVFLRSQSYVFCSRSLFYFISKFITNANAILERGDPSFISLEATLSSATADSDLGLCTTNLFSVLYIARFLTKLRQLFILIARVFVSEDESNFTVSTPRSCYEQMKGIRVNSVFEIPTLEVFLKWK